MGWCVGHSNIEAHVFRFGFSRSHEGGHLLGINEVQAGLLGIGDGGVEGGWRTITRVCSVHNRRGKIINTDARGTVGRSIGEALVTRGIVGVGARPRHLWELRRLPLLSKHPRHILVPRRRFSRLRHLLVPRRCCLRLCPLGGI